MRTAPNIAVFYAGWLASVMSAAGGYGLAALGGGLAVVALHLALAPDRMKELKLVAAAGIVGIAAEGLLMGLGFASYAEPGPLPSLPPAWLVGLWMAFATTMNVSLGRLKDHLLLSGILGLLVAPASYWAGEKIGGMALAEPRALSLAAVGLVWSLAFPLLVVLARRWNGMAAGPPNGA